MAQESPCRRTAAPGRPKYPPNGKGRRPRRPKTFPGVFLVGVPRGPPKKKLGLEPGALRRV
eukprot:8358511-Pyramimonas_sp.AAC.1